MSLPRINQVATQILEAIEEARREPSAHSWPVLLLVDGVWVRGYFDLEAPADSELLSLVDGSILLAPVERFDSLVVNLFDVKAFARQSGEFSRGDGVGGA
jgi:hypothetical protein